jgi:hypothetical protein
MERRSRGDVRFVRRAFVVFLLGVSACARRTAPVDPSARALFRDLERQVTGAAAARIGKISRRFQSRPEGE